LQRARDLVFTSLNDAAHGAPFTCTAPPRAVSDPAAPHATARLRCSIAPLCDNPAALCTSPPRRRRAPALASPEM